MFNSRAFLFFVIGFELSTTPQAAKNWHSGHLQAH